MKFVTNFPLYDGCLDGYPGGMKAVAADCRDAGIDGLEVIWDHNPYTQELPPDGLAIGYHMLFWSCWLDFYTGNQDLLRKSFSDDMDVVSTYYYGDTPDSMIELYKRDLRRAKLVNPQYLVFHVSEVALDECFTYDFRHTDEEVIDASLEIINQITDGLSPDVAFLVENQWWPGLTFTNPKMTKRLLDGIAHPNKGVMLDIGHLLHTNNKLRTQKQACEYIDQMMAEHAELGDCVRGLHLHYSLTGQYVEDNAYKIPDDFTGGYWDKFTRTYDHILQIDKHQPWTDPAIADVVKGIDPEWVNNELSAAGREAHLAALKTQMQTLEKGGLSHTSALI